MNEKTSPPETKPVLTLEKGGRPATRHEAQRLRPSVAGRWGNVVFLRPGVVRRDRREPDAAA